MEAAGHRYVADQRHLPDDVARGNTIDVRRRHLTLDRVRPGPACTSRKQHSPRAGSPTQKGGRAINTTRTPPKLILSEQVHLHR